MGGTVLSAGLVLGAISRSWSFASFVAGRLMVRTSYRLVAVFGGLSLVAGSLLLVVLEPGRALAWAATGSFVRGLDRARRGDFLIHVYAHRRPIGRCRGVWRGAQFRPLSSCSGSGRSGKSGVGSGVTPQSGERRTRTTQRGDRIVPPPRVHHCRSRSACEAPPALGLP